MKRKYTVTVEIDVDVWLGEMEFPKDENGVYIWTPIFCIEDAIEHWLHKDYDLMEGLEERGWRVVYPEELIEELTKMMITDFWSHQEDEKEEDST